jgi:hypothetical protein
MVQAHQLLAFGTKSMAKVPFQAFLATLRTIKSVDHLKRIGFVSFELTVLVVHKSGKYHRLTAQRSGFGLCNVPIATVIF